MVMVQFGFGKSPHSHRGFSLGAPAHLRSLVSRFKRLPRKPFSAKTVEKVMTYLTGLCRDCTHFRAAQEG